MPRKPRKPKRLYRNRAMKNVVFPFEENATIHGVWFLQCGTGNLVSIIWQNPGQPLTSRARHENLGRKQVFSYGKPNASLPEMIANTRSAIGGYAVEMERVTGQPMPVRQKLGPMSIHDMVDWLERTGLLRFTNGEILSTKEDTRDPEEKRVDDHYMPQFMAMQWENVYLAIAAEEAVVLAAMHRDKQGYLALPRSATTRPDCTEHHIPSDINLDGDQFYSHMVQLGNDYQAQAVSYSYIGSDDTINTLLFVRPDVLWHCRGKLVGDVYHRLAVKRVDDKEEN